MKKSTPRSRTSFQDTTRAIRDLYAQIKAGQVAPVYLFYGDEDYFREQVARNVAHLLVPPGDRLTNLDILEGEEVQLNELLGALETTGFNFGETARRVILVRRAPFFSPKNKGAETEEKTEAAEESVSRGDPSQTLLRRLERGLLADLTVIFTVAGPVDQRRKLFQFIDRIGVVLEFPALRGEEELGRFVRLKLAGDRVQIDADALHELSVRVGPQAQILTHELSKLVAYLGDRRTITRADVVAVVSPSAELSVFDLVDAVAERKTAAALEQLDGLLAQQVSPFMILALLIRQFRLLLQARYVIEQRVLGGSPWRQDANSLRNALQASPNGVTLLDRALEATASVLPQTSKANLLRQHPYALWKTLRQAEAFTDSDLAGALERLLQADLSLKTSYLSPEQVLELLVIDLCERMAEGATMDLDELLEV